jgi:hypothetical protein
LRYAISNYPHSIIADNGLGHLNHAAEARPLPRLTEKARGSGSRRTPARTS